MTTRRTAFPGLVALSLLAAPGLALAADGPKPQTKAKVPPGRPYSLVAEGDIKVVMKTGDEKPTRVVTWTRVDYLLDRKPLGLDVVLHAFSSAVRRNGEPLGKTSLSRTLFREKSALGDEVVDIPYDLGKPAMQALLRDFDEPAVSLTLDASGRELSRKVGISSPNAKNLLDLVDMLLSIHAPVPTGQDTWQAPASVATGAGQTARGPVRFLKVGRKDGLARVRVSGELRLVGAVGENRLKNSLYRLEGEQLYDPAASEWKSARWDIDVSADVVSPNTDKTVGSMAGTLVLTVGPPESLKTPPDALKNEPASATRGKP